MTLYRNFIRNNFHIFSKEKLFIVLVQPLVVILIRFVLPDSIFFISFVLAIVLLTSVQFAKNEKRSQFLYYWTVMSLSYTFIFFELIIVPLSEITPEENYLLMFFSGTSLIFLYFTTNVNAPNTGDLAGEHLLNKNGSASICPACKLKMEPRNFHCKICMECIPKYDHHSYWLNCCIGGKNFHCYLAGIFFGVFALAFASLLILTTICTPEYVFGILVPEDCTDVCSNIE
ncbi:hypothetical protein RUM44_013586 [Polyplax serrata]|uniref:Palmitoyltransferase n=1 Tax=Polyplax serrata TaxID=468196 RepID=A0ABR1BEJ9_POLSC